MDSKTKLASGPEKNEKFQLAKKPSEPKESIGDYTLLIYGEKKIGKTSLASKFPSAQFLMFEPGGKALRILQNKMDSWATFRSAVIALETDEDSKTVVVDTVDVAYQMCFEYMCKKLAIEHPQDERDFGKSWGQIEKEFIYWFTRLLQLDKGIILISHATEIELESRGGRKFHKIQPSAAKQAYRFLTGVVDTWSYYGYDGEERRFWIDGSDLIAAGTRIEEHFLTPKGERIVSIPMGKTSQEAYTNLLRAFNNKQTDTGEESDVKGANL